MVANYFGGSVSVLPILDNGQLGDATDTKNDSGEIGPTKASIAPEGNTRIDSGAILRKITTQAGDTYNQAALRKDLKEIYAMGYFNDVQIDVSDSPKGKKVIFRIVEKPVIKTVIFEDAKNCC